MQSRVSVVEAQLCNATDFYVICVRDLELTKLEEM